MRKYLLLLFVLQAIYTSAFTGIVNINGIWYNIATKSQSATVSDNDGYDDTPSVYSGDIVIPSTVEYEGVECKVVAIRQSAFMKCDKLKSVQMPNSITSIGSSSFYGCSELTSLDIPVSVKSIGAYAFQGCSKLSSITMGNEIVSIGVSAFMDCVSLNSIIIPSKIKEIDTGTFAGCTNINSVQWGDNIVQINARAFDSCSSLREIGTLENVSYIGQETFKGCSKLQSISLSTSLKTIFDGTFEGCSNLEEIVIPNGVNSIGRNCFRNCGSLASITLPATLASIGPYAFGDCPEITDFYCYAINPPSAETFTFIHSYTEFATLHVPESALNKYKEKYPWNSVFGTIVAINENMKCGTPTITYSNGKLIYTSITDDVEFISVIKDTDVRSYQTNEVNICATYTIEVYAKKSGYNNSEIATATLCWIDMEPKMEGITGVVSEVRALPVLIQVNEGDIQISGISSGTEIKVFNLAGMVVGLGTSTNTGITIRTNLKKNDTAILKIGEKTVKTIIR